MKNQTAVAAAVVTGASVLGSVKIVSAYHPAVDAGDECSQCGEPFRGDDDVVLADCGRYCSRRCAEAHGEFLAYMLNSDGGR